VNAGTRIQRFVQSLLSFARPTTGEGRDLDINAVLSDSVRLCSYDLAKFRLEVETVLAPGLPPIHGIEAELQQVFINLFTNAAHAMPESGGRLKVSTTSASDSGVQVTIADDGKGIPAVALPKIWEPFFTTKAEGAGTGLGLSIVKRVIEQHQGRIRVDSVEGKGTTFTLDLPASRPSDRRAATN
jgi:two-component system NtrC family sensor kinase